LHGPAGAAGREVGWLTTVRIRRARPQELRPGELLLLPPERGVAGVGLAAVLRQLLRVERAALAVWEPISPDAAALLSGNGVPWIAVPTEASHAAIEREVTRCIADRQAELQRLETMAYRELLELVIHGRGVGTLLAALARLTDKAVALENAEQQLLWVEWPTAGQHDAHHAGLVAPSPPELVNGRGAVGVRGWLAGLPISATDLPTARFDLDSAGWARLVAPVQGVGGLAGLLSLVARRERLTARDRLLLKRATAACALEFAKQTAVADAQEQPRGDFVASLLSGDLPEPHLVQDRAARLGLHLGSTHNVLTLRPVTSSNGVNGHDALVDRKLEELLAWQLGADAQAVPYRAAAGIAALVLPVERFGDARGVAAWAASFHRQVAAEAGPQGISGGLGQAQEGLGGIRDAYQGAVWAPDLGERLFGPGRLIPSPARQ
jgi:hypothetical protein